MTIRFCLNDLGGPSAWAPFPKKPATWTEPRHNGTVAHYFASPPIQYGNKAWRYYACKIMNPDGSITIPGDPYYSVQRCEGWSGYIAKGNWAGMVYQHGHNSHYWQSAYDYKRPIILARKWLKPLTEFLYAEQPELLAEKLETLNAGLKADKDEQTRKRQQQKDHIARYGNLDHGTIALTHDLKDYSGYGEHRTFYMFRDPETKAKGLTAFIKRGHNFIPVRVRHTSFNTFCRLSDAAFEDCWPDASAHDRLRLYEEENRLQEAIQNPAFTPHHRSFA